MYKLEEELFDQTDLVDRDELFKIDTSFFAAKDHQLLQVDLKSKKSDKRKSRKISPSKDTTPEPEFLNITSNSFKKSEDQKKVA
mgnify:CR=1 FL=1